MGVIKNFFKEFDMFACPASLRAKQQPQTTSTCAGIVSFILALIFSYVFVVSMIGIITFDKIESKQTEGRLNANDIKADNILFALGINFDEVDNFTQYFDYQVSVVDYGTSNIISIQLEQCKPEQWKKLGDEYEQNFYDQGLDYFLCPVSTDQLDIKGNYIKQNYKYISIQLYPCQNSSLSGFQCSTKQQSQQYINDVISSQKYISVWIYFLDTALQTDKKNPFVYHLNTDTRLTFTAKRGVQALIQIGTYQIETDVGFLPIEQKVTERQTFIQQVRTGSYQINNFGQQPYAQVYVVMNQKEIIVQRTVGKFDEVLSYAGGLFSIIIGFLSFFMMSFNEYRYQLMVAEGAFNLNQHGKKIKEHDLHFLKYIKYSIYDWINTLLCCHLNWKECQQIDLTRQQANCQMDVTRLFNKIRNLEVSLSHLMSQSQRICLTLIQPPSLQKVRKNRLIHDYYNAVIQGKPALTIEDINIVNGTLDLGMKLTRQGHSLNLESQYYEDRSRIMEVAMRKFPQIEAEALAIELPQELVSIEEQIAQNFYKCNEQARRIIQQKIPIKILHRLRMKQDHVNSKSSFHILLE